MTMGKTGAGISTEDQINMDENNNFMNKWSTSIFLSEHWHVFTVFLELIKTNFLWLWEMKVLISERLNITPVGLHNSESVINMSGYKAGYKTDGNASKPVTNEDKDNDVDRDTAKDDDNDNIDNGPSIPRKCHAGSGHSTKKNKITLACQKVKASKPNIHCSKKMKPLECSSFADLASAEEVTNQKNLDLKKLKSWTTLVKIKAKVDIQIHHNKLKAKVWMLERKQEHDFHMAQLNLQLACGGGTASGSLSTSFYGTSPYPSQAEVTGLFNMEECSQSTCSFSTGLSFAFDLNSFGYNTIRKK